jgi:acyl-CoA thioesterase
VVIRRIEDKLRQSRGFVHGGVYATIIDAALGEVVHASLGEGGSAVTIELNMNLMRAVADGGLTAYGQVIHSTGSLVVGTADVRDDHGELVASGRGTFRVRRPDQPDLPDQEEQE